MKHIIKSLLVVFLLLGTYTAKAQTEPSFVMEQARKTFMRYINWKGGEETLVFPILTDVHSEWCAGREMNYKHFGYIVATDRLFGYDFMANLGDIGLNGGPAHTSAEAADDLIMRTKEQMGLFPGMWIYAPGNHDWDGGGDRHLTSQFLSDVFQKPSERYANGNLHIAEGKAYGYYDIPEKKVRIFFLNSEGTETQGENYYTFDNEQLEWFTNILKDTEEGTDILTLAHYMPHPIGRWTCVKDAVRPTCEILCHLLADFTNRRKGGELGVEWDFRKCKGRLIGLFCGDTHCNQQVCDDGVNYYITQGMGMVDPKEMLPGQTHAEYNAYTSLCCDVIAIKLKSKEVRTFRIGAGGEEYDLTFPY